MTDAWTAYCRRVWEATQAQLDVARLWEAVQDAPKGLRVIEGGRQPRTRTGACPMCLQRFEPGDRITSKGAHVHCQYGDDP